MSLSRSVVAVLRRKQREGIPAAIGAKTRLHVADAVAIALATRRRLPIAGEVLEALSTGAARGDCRVIGRAETLPPALAAFANSALIHALDYDDIHDVARLHPTTVTLPAALAAADLADASGRTVVEAVALGNELMCRLGVVCSPTGTGPGSDWFLTQLFGYFGASIAAGLVLGLDDEEIVSAFGLAYMQAAGSKEAAFGVGATSRSIYPAFAAMGGVQAALLARAGIVGPAGALDGAAGLFRLYLGDVPEPAQLATLLDRDGWTWRDTDIKPWPSCRLSHPYVAAALAVRGALAGRPIERIRVAVNESAGKLCRPLPERRRPRTLQDAKYSIPFMTAFTLAHGRVDLETLGPRAFDDPAALALAERIEIAETLPDGPGHPPAEIAVELASGQSVASPPPTDLRMTEGAVRAKFLSCLAHGGFGEDGPALWEALMQIETRGRAAAFGPVALSSGGRRPAEPSHR